MAKLEQTLNGNFNQMLNKIEQGILNGSMSASLEESSDFHSGDAVFKFLNVITKFDFNHNIILSGIISLIIKNKRLHPV